MGLDGCQQPLDAQLELQADQLVRPSALLLMGQCCLHVTISGSSLILAASRRTTSSPSTACASTFSARAARMSLPPAAATGCA